MKPAAGRHAIFERQPDSEGFFVQFSLFLGILRKKHGHKREDMGRSFYEKRSINFSAEFYIHHKLYRDPPEERPCRLISRDNEDNVYTTHKNIAGKLII